MSTNLPIEVSDHAFQALASTAGNAGKTPAELAAAVVEREYGFQPTKTDPEAAQVVFESISWVSRCAAPVSSWATVIGSLRVGHRARGPRSAPHRRRRRRRRR